MLPTLSIAVLSVLRGVLALRSADVTICDYYTPKVLGQENSAKSQYQLMLTVVNTVILGNYTATTTGVTVHGIAAPGSIYGHQVNLLPYFDGGYASTNEGGQHGTVKNFLDDGGATPLQMNKPANSEDSNQYNLLTHLYEYFGMFFGCSKQGGADFPSYQGRASMYDVHKYMVIDKYEVAFFIEQVVSAVAAFGFEQPDVVFTNTSLYKTFGNRCSQPAAVIPPDAGKQLQSICAAGDCPLDADANCADGPIEQPRIANATLVGNVTKEIDTQAATTASWPSHSGTASTTSSATSKSKSKSAASRHGAVAGAGAWQFLASFTAVCVGAGIFAILI